MKKEYLYKAKGPIINWHEGLMLGNGTIGALIYGEKDLVFSLDRVDLWDNRKTSEIKEKGFTFQNMVETMNNDWKEYLRLFNNCYDHPYPTKINAGSLVFENIVNPQTIFNIDIEKAEYKVKNKTDSFSGYLDANSNVLKPHILSLFCLNICIEMKKIADWLIRIVKNIKKMNIVISSKKLKLDFHIQY